MFAKLIEMTSLPAPGTLRTQAVRLLDGYSPFGLLVVVLPFFIPVERELARRLLLLFCALPAMALCALNLKECLKNPALWLIGLFTAYFSVQQARGMLPLDTHILRMILTTAMIIIGPVILFSRIRIHRTCYPIVIRIILTAAAIRVGYELVHFYSKAPFPLARFAGMGHPVSGSRITGFAAVLAGALFLQSGPKLKRWDWLPLLTAPLFLAAALYSHSRSTAIAIACTLAAAVLGIKTRAKKTILLFTVAAITFAAYTASVQLAPDPVKRIRPNGPKDFSQPASKKKKPPRKRKYTVRQGGVLTTDKGGQISANARLDIWKDHFSRINTPQDWLIGKGLGMNAFVPDPQPAATHWYQWTEHGWQLNVHSGYIWALYHGGMIGLSLLLLLFGLTALSSLWAGREGYVTLALILYVSVSLLVNGQRLLTGDGATYLAFWIPIGLAAGLPLTLPRKKS